MPTDSLNRLTIDKTRQMTSGGGKWGRKRLIAIVAVVLAAAAIYMFSLGRGIVVETTSVNRVYPTQSFTLLNASGYVAAQRKAAVAS